MSVGWYDKTKHAIRYFLLRRLPACQHTVELISQSLERSLTWRERAALKLHLWICVWCLWYLEHLQIMRQTMLARGAETPEMDYPSAPVLSSEARERIKRQLANQQ
jgi:Putative zinc-finger